MRYANIERLGGYDAENIMSVGDYIQLVAIDNIYKEMGVESDVIYLDSQEIISYRGEKLILPINQLITGYPLLDKDGNFSFSKDIQPIFLGISLREGFFVYSDYNLNFLKSNAPIGCRDYYTFQQMQKYNIPAYMAGCLTMTLPKREDIGKYSKVFLVDTPSSLKKYIPKNILKHSEIVHHDMKLSGEEYKDRSYAMKVTKESFKKYQEEAGLVITSRLHCASPCLAMGIPVILAKQYKGYTFDWLQNFVTPYTEETYADILWNPQPISVEKYKKIAKEVAIKRINGTFMQGDARALQEFYMRNYSKEYEPEEMSLTHFIKEIKKRYNKDDSFDYAIWGVSRVAENIYEYLSTNYPNAKLVEVIDSFSEKMFHGIASKKPSILQKEDSFVTIVVTINCVNDAAKPLFDYLGKDESQYIYAADTFL